MTNDLAGVARTFARYPTGWILSGYLATALAVRTARGDWGAGDLAVVVGLVAAQPFVEWVIHVVVLHWKPRTIFGRTIDVYLARKHRAHHRDPRNLPLVFFPLRALLLAAPVTTLLYWLVFPSGELAATALATSAAITLTYEWLHFLIHTDYRPRHALYRRIHRAHRLHHFKNERYWFGVTSTVADHVLGTFPDRDGVETSPTARTLVGVE